MKVRSIYIKLVFCNISVAADKLKKPAIEGVVVNKVEEGHKFVGQFHWSKVHLGFPFYAPSMFFTLEDISLTFRGYIYLIFLKMKKYKKNFKRIQKIDFTHQKREHNLSCIGCFTLDCEYEYR